MSITSKIKDSVIYILMIKSLLAPKERIAERHWRVNVRIILLITSESIRIRNGNRWPNIIWGFLRLTPFWTLLCAWTKSLSFNCLFITDLVLIFRKLGFYLIHNSWRIWRSFELSVSLYRLVLFDHLLVVRSALYVVASADKAWHLFKYSPNSMWD